MAKGISNTTLPTRYTCTGQYSYINDEATDLGSAGFGLMFYNARWLRSVPVAKRRGYDPALGRFAQADSIIPASQGVQAWHRYAYVNNNPVIYTDPSGHNCVLGTILGLFNFSYSCPTSGGTWIEGFDRVPEDNWIEGFDPAPQDDSIEGFDPSPNANDLKIIASEETEEGDDDEWYDDEDPQIGKPKGGGEGRRPGSNTAQNDEFEGAVKELQRQLGRKLDHDEIQQLHRALHELEDPGFWDIVEQGLKEFGE